MSDLTGIELIQELEKKKLSKYAIAKRVGCSWNTVDMWQRGVWNPSPKYRTKLIRLLNNGAKG